MIAPTRTPPRFVPTLTEVVNLPDAPLSGGATPTPAHSVDPDVLEELLVHRVLQRIDLVLESRISAAIAHVVEEQTRSLQPRLREEIEAVVRASVNDALATELAAPAAAAGQGDAASASS